MSHLEMGYWMGMHALLKHTWMMPFNFFYKIVNTSSEVHTSLGSFFAPCKRQFRCHQALLIIFLVWPYVPRVKHFLPGIKEFIIKRKCYELMKWFSIAINYSQLISWYGLRWEYEYFPEYNVLLIFINSFSSFLLEIYKLVPRHGGCFLSVTLSQPHLRKPFLAMSHIFLRYEK